MMLPKLIMFHECKLGSRLVIFLYTICECISCSEESVAEALVSWEFQQVASWVLLAEVLICNTGHTFSGVLGGFEVMWRGVTIPE